MTHRGPFQPLLFCDSVIFCWCQAAQCMKTQWSLCAAPWGCFALCLVFFFPICFSSLALCLRKMGNAPQGKSEGSGQPSPRRVCAGLWGLRRHDGSTAPALRQGLPFKGLSAFKALGHCLWSGETTTSPLPCVGKRQRDPRLQAEGTGCSVSSAALPRRDPSLLLLKPREGSGAKPLQLLCFSSAL